MDLKKEVKEIIKWAQESEENKKEAFDKISYNLLDIILQNKETK